MTEIVKIDDATWRIEDSYVRFFLLTGSKKAALIDSGIASKDAKEIAMTLTNLPIMLVNTHGDGDHISGTGAFPEIYMAPEDYQNKGMDNLFPNTKLQELHDKDTIDLGDRTLEVVKIPGHTKGSIALIDVQKRYLFSGDTVQSGSIYMFGPHRDPSLYEGSLLKLISMKERFDVIFPSHDTPSLSPDYIEKVLVSWRQVRAGNVSWTPTNLHDTDVKSYKAKWCGFYCE